MSGRPLRAAARSLARAAAGLLAAAVLTSVTPAPAAATTVVALDNAQLAANSAYVVRGTIVDARVATYDVQPELFTEYDVRVDEVLGADAPVSDTLVVRVPGGQTAGRHVQVAGMPGFTVGDEVVLFLEALPDAFGPDAAPGYLPVGLEQGVWRQTPAGDWQRGDQDGLIGPVLAEPEPLPLRAIRQLAVGGTR